uniref:Putative secreted protein n=1 Tax=Anopheles marajoara TaxID=58244 RepID=A0A2M4C6T2_9DIPT
MRNFVLFLLRQLCIGCIVAGRLKDWIPSEISRATWLDDSALGAALEQKHLSVGLIGVSKRTDCLGRLVFPSGQQLMQSFGAQLIEKPFDVRTRKSFERVETQARVFNHHRPLHLASGFQALSFADVVDLPLQLR